MNHEPVYRTAPATPGLLSMYCQHIFSPPWKQDYRLRQLLCSLFSSVTRQNCQFPQKIYFKDNVGIKIQIKAAVQQITVFSVKCQAAATVHTRNNAKTKYTIYIH